MPFDDAGWSSLVAREAHNLEVAGSNPAPATIFEEIEGIEGIEDSFLAPP